MRVRPSPIRLPSAMLALLFSAGVLGAQSASSVLPATPPTHLSPTNATPPLAGTAGSSARSGSSAHPATVQCQGGLLEVRANNSGLNQILRAISRCTGMRITGAVAEQRVFGNYGPAAAATVLATLLDGTGSNMLLRETAADHPAELILTARTGGVTPPGPSTDEDADNGGQEPDAPAQTNLFPQQPGRHLPNPMNMTSPDQRTAAAYGAQVPQPSNGSAVTSPPAIPIGINNVNGDPRNTSPTASTYPTTNSVPLDSVATPSTTPASNGIVDAPNPPPAGSDTAAALNGAPAGTPGTTSISPDNTSPTYIPGASNTALPAGVNSGQGTPTELTPEQIFQQLQQRQQQQQQQQGQQPQ